MKHFLLFMLAVVAGSAIAQPTINSNVFAPLGFTSRYIRSSAAAVNNFNAGSAGANITWNFTTLDTTGGTSTQKTVKADTCAEYPDFPSVVNRATEVTQFGAPIHGFYFIDNSKLEYYGYQAFTGIQKYDGDPEKVLQFPFTYNNQFTDAFKSANDVYVGTTLVKADAYGTLKLPTGTFANVLRITTKENYYTFIDGDITEDTLFYEGTYYRWYQPNTTNVLLEYSKLLQVVYYQGVRYETDSVKHVVMSKTAIATGVDEIAATFGAVVYPNPAGGDITVSSEEVIDRVQITNIYGQLVMEQNSDAKKFGINLENLVPGNYFIELITPDNRRKTVKVTHF